MPKKLLANQKNCMKILPQDKCYKGDDNKKMLNSNFLFIIMTWLHAVYLKVSVEFLELVSRCVFISFTEMLHILSHVVTDLCLSNENGMPAD